MKMYRETVEVNDKSNREWIRQKQKKKKRKKNQMFSRLIEFN